MVEHDALVRKGAGKVQHIAQLRFQHPGIESQPALAQMRKTAAEGIVTIQPFRCVERRAEHGGVGIPCALMADAAEPSVARRHQRIQHWRNSIAQRQVRMTDNRRTRPGRAIQPARALRRDPVDIFDLANRLHRRVARRTVERAALHKDGADDVVTRRHIGGELFEPVLRRTRDGLHERMPGFGKGGQHGPQVPQVMMRIEDRQIGFEDRFGHEFFYR